MNDDLELKNRLAAMEDRAPAFEPPAIPARRHRSVVMSFAMASVLTLAFAATAVATVAIVGGIVHGHPGVENPGQPLFGANLECMTPPQAAAYLAEHGYTDVVWQIESGGLGKSQGTTVLSSVAPAHGFVVPGSMAEDGKLHVVIDQRSGASGVGACVAMPMP
ncbi:MAG: hypothetical protein ACXWNR_01695 [Candidatus Limnocylindrales bacterium]